VDVDVVVVGAGVIGLWTAYDALRQRRRSGGDGDVLSVALVDASHPVAGGTSAQATGAGQGYLWLSHREAPLRGEPAQPPPSAASWHLAARGKRRWERLATANADPITAELARRAQLRTTGSLLLATTDEEVASLEVRAARLCAAPGGPSEAAVRVLATPQQVAADEPALATSSLVRAALLVESDAQIDGRGAALGLLDACRALGGGDGARFVEALDDAAVAISPAPGGGSGGASVETASGRCFTAHRGVVVAGGAWTGALLADTPDADDAWRAFFAPRRGHLLEVDAAAARLPAPLRRGAMELSYSRHYKHAGEGAAKASSSGDSEVTFTITGGAGANTLLLGSSREDAAGFDGRADAGVVAAILRRAAEFLPSLDPLAQRAAVAARTSDDAAGSLSGVRVGVRPWAAGGLPAVGPVPGLPGVVVAAGHEGSGLTMAPATAELALRWVGLRMEDEEEGEDDCWWGRRDDEAGGGGGASICEEHLLPERRLAAVARSSLTSL
jgi:glycine/D-amino acid oxidase-like deaminating enzyme